MKSGIDPVFRIFVTRFSTQLPTFGVQLPIQSAPPWSAIFDSSLDCSGSLCRRSLALRNAGAYSSLQYLAPVKGFSPCFQGGSGGAAGSAGLAAGLGASAVVELGAGVGAAAAGAAPGAAGAVAAGAAGGAVELGAGAGALAAGAGCRQAAVPREARTKAREGLLLRMAATPS